MSERRYSTRPEERDQMETLNTRLEVYINRVRDLETKNEELEEQVTVMHKSRTSLANVAVRKLEEELALAKADLSKDNEENARLKLELAAQRDLSNRLQRDLNDLNKDHDRVKKQLTSALGELEKLRSQAAAAEERYALELNTTITLKKRVESLEAEVDIHRKRADAEAMSRIGLENRITDLEEQLEAKENAHVAMIAKMEEEVQVASVTRVRSDRDIRDQYNEELARALADAKQHYLEAAEVYRDELREHYDNRIAILPGSNNSEELNTLRTSVEEWRAKYTMLEGDLLGSQNEVNAFRERIRALEATLRRVQEENATTIKNKDDAIHRISADLHEKEELYKDLLDKRIQLDAEIDYYRKLLDGEYTRLSMPGSPSSTTKKLLKRTSAEAEMMTTTSASVTRKELRAASSKSFKHDVTTHGDISIDDFDDENGYFIELLNVTDKQVNLAGYTLTVSNGEHEDTFKFPRNTKIGAEKKKRVLNGEGKDIKRAGDVMWSDMGRFVLEDELTITLKDKEGEVVCTMEILADQFPLAVGTSGATMHGAPSAKRAKEDSGCSFM